MPHSPRPKFSVARETYITEQSRLFLARIKRSQGVLSSKILDDFIKTLDTTGGKVATTARNYQLIAQLDVLYAEFVRTEGVALMEDFVKRTDPLFSLNEKYFRGATSVSDATFTKAMQAAREFVYASIGVDLKNNRIIKTGPLGRIISDFAPVNAIKESLFNAVSNNVLTVVMREDVQVITVGDDTTEGSLVKHINRTMDQPFEKFDRSTGTNASINLKMNFAQYGGGLVPLSRDFCIVRNRKVFSREEIGKFGTPQDEFGGYTNKSAGEFQGKPKVGYNPFVSLGGHNCLHKLDWISDELAFRLRPELKPAAS